MNKFVPILTCLLLIASHSECFARDYIRVVGSSTVYPFVAAAAEQFGQIGAYKTPVVESTGTGGGIKLFCEGLGDVTPDFVNASRAMKDSERAQCIKNGVTDIQQIELGYDGIAFVNKLGAPLVNVSKKQLFLALAREIPKNGKLVTNPNKSDSN
jgi:phosphate transport system substrate-binding protein